MNDDNSGSDSDHDDPDCVEASEDSFMAGGGNIADGDELSSSSSEEEKVDSGSD